MNTPDWPNPTDLRCVGGPADGKWFAVPPEGYYRYEERGGAVWLLARRYDANGNRLAPWVAAPLPRSALPGESP